MAIITHTTWGREFTPEEIEKMEARRAKLLADGVTLHTIMFQGDTLSRAWDTEELANDWVNFANSLNPPPVKIEIEITD